MAKHEPKMIIVPIKDCVPNKWNPNKMSDHDFKALKNEIATQGFLHPILINQDNVIIDGYHRWLAAKEIGMTDIHAITIQTTEAVMKILTRNGNLIKGEMDPLLYAKMLKELLSEYDMEQLSAYIYTDPIEIQSHIDLLDLPEFKEDMMENVKADPEIAKCPKCGHEFEV